MTDQVIFIEQCLNETNEMIDLKNITTECETNDVTVVDCVTGTNIPDIRQCESTINITSDIQPPSDSTTDKDHSVSVSKITTNETVIDKEGDLIVDSDSSSQIISDTKERTAYGFPISFGKIDWRSNKTDSLPLAFGSTHIDTNASRALCDLIRVSKTETNPIDESNNKNINLENKNDSVKSINNDSIDNIAHHYSYDEDDLEDSSLYSIPPSGFIPKAQTIMFEAHHRATTALGINPKGSRLATGGHDSEIRLWDFNGMTSEPKSFRRFTPVANHSIRSLSYSPTGSHFICAAGDAIGRVYDVDGNKIHETVKGDMYVRDLAKTKGHTHGLTCCEWHPFDRDRFMTASADATVRIFDMNAKLYGVDQALPHLHILKAIDKRNLNIAGQCRITAAKWSVTSCKFIVAGCSDGSLQLWNERKAYGKPDKVIRTAHTTGTEISGLSILRDDIKVISRGMDNSMKLWDIRQFKEPVHSWNELPNDITGLGLCLNPDETLVVTGTSSPTTQATVKVFDVNTFESVASLPLCSSVSETTSRGKGFAVQCVLWPEPLNQLIFGCTDGTVRVQYDTVYSQKGALLFAHRPGISRRVALQGFQAPVFTVDALPAGYKETRWGKIRKVKPKEKEKIIDLYNRPCPPSTFSMPNKLTNSTTAFNKVHVVPPPKEDPVEAIRAYAAKAEADPVFVTTAYTQTQPKLILDYSMEGGDDEKLVSNVSKCPRCGLKLCQCGYMKLSDAIRGPASKQRRTK